MLSGQQLLDALNARMRAAKGRDLNAQEIEQAKTSLPNWQTGVDEAQLAPLYQYIDGVTNADSNPVGPVGYGEGVPNPTINPDLPQLTPTDVGSPPGTPPDSTVAPGGDQAAPASGPFPTFTPDPAPTPGTYAAPTYQAPTYTPPASFEGPQPFRYDPFSYEGFSAPSMEDAENEPGYAFARDQGRKALENSAASRGVLRTGGSMKDLYAWGDQFAQQNYGGVFNRKAQIYDTNRSNAYGNWAANRNNAADAYATNYGVSKEVFGLNTDLGQQTFDRNAIGSKAAFDTNASLGKDAFDTNTGNRLDVYDRNFSGAAAGFNSKFEGAKLTFEDLYRRWRDSLDATTRVATAGAY